MSKWKLSMTKSSQKLFKTTWKRTVIAFPLVRKCFPGKYVAWRRHNRYTSLKNGNFFDCDIAYIIVHHRTSLAVSFDVSLKNVQNYNSIIMTQSSLLLQCTSRCRTVCAVPILIFVGSAPPRTAYFLCPLWDLSRMDYTICINALYIFFDARLYASVSWNKYDGFLPYVMCAYKWSSVPPESTH